jgi:hypothetical protein
LPGLACSSTITLIATLFAPFYGKSTMLPHILLAAQRSA